MLGCSVSGILGIGYVWSFKILQKLYRVATDSEHENENENKSDSNNGSRQQKMIEKQVKLTEEYE